MIFGMVAEANWDEDSAIDVLQGKDKTKREKVCLLYSAAITDCQRGDLKR